VFEDKLCVFLTIVLSLLDAECKSRIKKILPLLTSNAVRYTIPKYIDKE
jgi:hypothetical protein